MPDLALLPTRIRSLIHEEISPLSVLRFPFRVVTPIRQLYYTGPATDFRRLEYEVRKKAAEIFADLIARLRQRHEIRT